MGDFGHGNGAPGARREARGRAEVYPGGVPGPGGMSGDGRIARSPERGYRGRAARAATAGLRQVASLRARAWSRLAPLLP
ncbi:hypothetical protein LA76x_1501 [Lysobacter antibioticus]|uniref:Uncharacterized protein n=1 Tax=Lysobacter antibioticus TaxID=84531 RepID=A0A0S2F7V9_LYSAN|nr:hypothetical protein LA76x_1501 [Lysobacter antibioticus]